MYCTFVPYTHSLCHWVGTSVEVESATPQQIPLFKGLQQQLPVEVGQYVGIASADGPLHLARLQVSSPRY